MNVRTDKHASYKLLGKELELLNYTSTIINQRPFEVEFKAPSGATWSLHPRYIHYPFDSNEVRDIASHKLRGYAFARSMDFPVPFTHQITGQESPEQFDDILRTYQTLIVKPENSSLSKGLTVDITSASQLKIAVQKAKVISPSVLIQEQVYGQEIRFTVLEGKVQAALLRETPRVIGDGVSTLAELIKQENLIREGLVFDAITYPQLDATLIDASLLASQDIPKKDHIVELSHATMIRNGCSVYNVLDRIHSSYIKKIEDMVASLDSSFIVVDVFCRDYTQQAALGNYWLIEFNSAPVLKLYYACRDGRHFDIAPLLARVIDRHINKDA